MVPFGLYYCLPHDTDSLTLGLYAGWRRSTGQSELVSCGGGAMLGSDCLASCPDINVCSLCSEGWGTQPPSALVPSSIRWRWSFHPCGIIVCVMWVHKCEAFATGPGVEDIMQDYCLFFSALWCLSISQGYCLFPEQIVGATALQP